MHQQAADQVGQHGGTNRGLGGGERGAVHTWITQTVSGCLRGKGTPRKRKRDTWGTVCTDRGSLYLLTRHNNLPLNYLGVMRWHLEFLSESKEFKGFKASVSSVLSTKRFLSGADRKEEGFTAGVVL